MSGQEHILKCWPIYFDAVARGEKTFEIRRDDRGFQKGDVLVLQRTEEDNLTQVEWSFDRPKLGERRKARRECRVRVLWILTGGQFGLEPGFVCMSIQKEHQP